MPISSPVAYVYLGIIITVSNLIDDMNDRVAIPELVPQSMR